MVFTCDVCRSEGATVHCFVDKASLCSACDNKLHTTSKAAQKHERVALTPHKEQTQCDICQEHPAVMFCAEDRALICRRCDLMIHTANEFTKTHHRYILSGFAAGLHPLPEPTVGGAKSLADVAGSRQGNKGAVGMPAIPSNGSSGDLLTMPKLPMGVAPMMDTHAMPQTSTPAQLASDSGSGGAGPGVAAGGASSSSGADRASSVTLAAELLGMPTLPQNYSAKDVDAAWGDAGLGDLDDWSNFLEVPDLGLLPDTGSGIGDASNDWLSGFGDTFAGPPASNPTVSVRDPSLVASAVPAAAPQAAPKAAAPAATAPGKEPLVPEVPSLKRPRIS